MANVLLLTGDIGPAEGSVYNNLKENGHQVFVYNVAGRWVPAEDAAPLWMKGHDFRQSPLGHNWFKRSIESKNVDIVISSGLQAGGFAASTFGGNFYPLLWRGNLDFLDRSEPHTKAFTELIRTSDRLLLEDPWEMDKAVAKGSQVTHLQMRYPSVPDRSYLNLYSNNLVIIHSLGRKRSAETLKEAAEEVLESDVGVDIVDIKTLFTAKDIEDGKDFHETLAERLSNYSYAIILGTGPHHSTVVRALAHDKQRVVVDQTVGMSFLSEELAVPNRARGIGCVNEMKTLIEASDLSLPAAAEPRNDVQDSDYLDSLRHLWQREVEWWFEELPGVLSTEPLNVFFSVGMVEDSTKGARHQRVRNMHDAFSSHQALNIFGTQPFLTRRLKLARKILHAGRPGGVFYGENSTSPMPKHFNDQLSNFLEEFSHHGGRSMWFVRDLHWLETFEESPWTEERATELISDGLYELGAIGDRANFLASPGIAAGNRFNALLTAAGARTRDWYPLPPAVQPQNIIDDDNSDSKDGTTLLYAGGISEIYQMGLYLSAISNLETPVMMDFVVRKPESDRLKIELDRYNLLNSERTRILHTTMDLYRSRTSRTIGMVLLDSAYAKFAFPYKTVTMVERGYPILCYTDMAIAEFVESNDLGVAVERSEEGIRAGIKSLITNGADGFDTIRKTETWENRVKDIYALLS